MPCPRLSRPFCLVPCGAVVPLLGSAVSLTWCYAVPHCSCDAAWFTWLGSSVRPYPVRPPDRYGLFEAPGRG
eukprot:3751711-Pyramimonas_sp.AAC.1